MARPKKIIAGEPTQGIEVHDDVEIVLPTAGNVDLKSIVTSEAFMNESVVVLVHSTTDENQAPSFILNVNGTNQPVMRGVPTIMKRKYLEVLARMKETKYTQITPNSGAPDQTIMQARHGLAYPFELQEDKNPLGREWLRNVLAEPA